jgi:hypothetical protein
MFLKNLQFYSVIDDRSLYGVIDGLVVEVVAKEEVIVIIVSVVLVECFVILCLYYMYVIIYINVRNIFINYYYY